MLDEKSLSNVIFYSSITIKIAECTKVILNSIWYKLLFVPHRNTFTFKRLQNFKVTYLQKLCFQKRIANLKFNI